MKIYSTERAVKSMIKRRGWQNFPHRIERVSGNGQYPAGGYVPVMICEEPEDVCYFRSEEVKTEWMGKQ